MRCAKKSESKSRTPPSSVPLDSQFELCYCTWSHLVRTLTIPSASAIHIGLEHQTDSRLAACGILHATSLISSQFYISPSSSPPGVTPDGGYSILLNLIVHQGVRARSSAHGHAYLVRHKRLRSRVRPSSCFDTSSFTSTIRARVLHRHVALLGSRTPRFV